MVGDLLRRGVPAIKVALQAVAPPALEAERRELVLPQHVSGEAVGVLLRTALRVGDQADLPVRLLEGLADLVPRQPGSPGQHVAGRVSRGMPESNLRLGD